MGKRNHNSPFFFGDYSNALLKDGYNFTMQTRNFLTFDIEEWFHANYEGIDLSGYDSRTTTLEANVDRLRKSSLTPIFK